MTQAKTTKYIDGLAVLSQIKTKEKENSQKRRAQATDRLSRTSTQGADMDWAALTERITSASRITLSDLIAQEGEASFYAFILYTDANCYTVLPSANSIEKLEEKIAKEGVEDPSEIPGFKWSIGEWAHEAWNDQAFAEISNDLSKASHAASEQEGFAEFRKQLHLAMTNAMLSLRNEGVFGRFTDQAVLFVSSSDYEESFEIENWSAQILNKASIHVDFLNRYEG